MLCKYKHIFGIPGEGLHKYRIFDIAIIDVLLTIILAIIISYLVKINFIIIFIILFLVGIIMHRIFCVRTTIDKLLF
jgi:hypothetical protein